MWMGYEPLTTRTLLRGGLVADGIGATERRAEPAGNRLGRRSRSFPTRL